MSSVMDEDLARVTIISPNRRVDLALPGSVTLGELMPSIVKFAGFEASNATDAVHTWVLQRFGEDPLDPTARVNKLSISDGETLHLRQRENALPDAAFDDVIDAVATTTTQRPSWLPKHSQRFTLGLMLVLMTVLPLMVISQPLEDEMMANIGRLLAPVGGHVWWGAIACGVLGFATAIASISVSRAVGEYRVASALAWGSVALAFLCGYNLLPGVASVPLRLTVGAAFVLVFAAALAIAAQVSVMPLFTAAMTALLVLVAGSVMTVLPDQFLTICAVGLCLLVAITAMLPTWSYKLAQIALPVLPPDAETMLADETPVQSDIVSRALLADRLLSAFLTSTSLAALFLSLPVLLTRGMWELLLVTAIGIALTLRSNAFVGLQQRLALLGTGTAMLLLAFAIGISRYSLLIQVVAGFSAAVLMILVLTLFATAIYNKVPSPVWGRVGDILEWLSIIAIIPLLLAMLNLYARFRGLTSS
ncbi:type VII secretion integral membrane protein EccD [Propionibacteriaceae bacterium Y1923]|uniref:type VII secretion integral membrane protein EccD n=1 Tax=Aestuariimicrobium sp. Y1814 TaxID=3418742 RepID=UPI003C150E0C